MDHIFDEIRDSAKKEAEQLVNRARRVAEREQQHAREETDAECAAYRETCAQRATVREERAAARRTAETRREELAQRERFIDIVFTDALKRLRDTPRDTRYEAWIRSMAEQALPAFGSATAVAVCNARDAAVVARALGGLPVALGTERADIAGGMVLKSPDGRLSIDCSAEATLARAQDEMRDEVLQRLGALD